MATIITAPTPIFTMPQPVDLRIDAGWIVPVEPAGALADHSLVIDAGRIVALVPRAQAAQFAPREHVTLPGHVLIPGLVNAHVHAAMTLLRGIADDVALKPWLEQHIWPREGRFLSAEFVHDGTRLAAAEMLRGGITCCNEMYYHAAAAAEAFDAAGMRALLGLVVLDLPTPYAADADGYLQQGLAVRDRFKRHPRLRFGLAPHAPYTASDATWQKVVMYAEQVDLPIQTHVAETRAEVEAALAQGGERPLQRLARLGATGPGFLAVHAVHVDAADIALLAAHGCGVVHCPASNMKLASGIAPVAALLAHGVEMALGTDGAASNNRLDVFAEMRLASLLAKVSTGDAAVLPAMQALHLATLGGARALGFGDAIGSLVPGKEADVVAVSLESLELVPVYDPVSHLVHAASRSDVTHVWIGGEARVRERALVHEDEAGLRERARRWQARLAHG
jgi:5-methylthioadenosine/S-adenosylhomocysteine deaminase